MQDPAFIRTESTSQYSKSWLEAVKKLASEPEFCKTVKKKRKARLHGCGESFRRLKNVINEYRIRCGKKPSQKATVILPG